MQRQQKFKFWGAAFKSFSWEPRITRFIFARLFGFDSAQLELSFAVVGRGDSTLIRSPSGQSVLTDGGRYDDTLARNYESRCFDLMIASHADDDRIGGLKEVRFHRLLLLMDSGVPHTIQTYSGLLEPLLKQVTRFNDLGPFRV